MNSLDLMDIDYSLQFAIYEDQPKIEEVPKNTYECSACGTLVQIDPMLIHHNAEWEAYSAKDLARINYWHSKYAYTKEVEPGRWLTFCRRVCEIKYNRQDEDGWEFSPNKK